VKIPQLSIQIILNFSGVFGSFQFSQEHLTFHFLVEQIEAKGDNFSKSGGELKDTAHPATSRFF